MKNLFVICCFLAPALCLGLESGTYKPRGANPILGKTEIQVDKLGPYLRLKRSSDEVVLNKKNDVWQSEAEGTFSDPFFVVIHPYPNGVVCGKYQSQPPCDVQYSNTYDSICTVSMGKIVLSPTSATSFVLKVVYWGLKSWAYIQGNACNSMLDRPQVTVLEYNLVPAKPKKKFASACKPQIQKFCSSKTTEECHAYLSNLAKGPGRVYNPDIDGTDCARFLWSED